MPFCVKITDMTGACNQNEQGVEVTVPAVETQLFYDSLATQDSPLRGTAAALSLGVLSGLIREGGSKEVGWFTKGNPSLPLTWMP